MPPKKIADTGKQILCPMPGLVVSIAVKEGQEVKAGEPVAVFEAMKMETWLRGEIDGPVKKITAKPGDSLAVDAVILEFSCPRRAHSRNFTIGAALVPDTLRR